MPARTTGQSSAALLAWPAAGGLEVEGEVTLPEGGVEVKELSAGSLEIGEVTSPERASGLTLTSSMVGISLVFDLVLMQQMSLPRSPTNNISTVPQYLRTVTRHDFCYFSVTLATFLEKIGVP